MRSPRPSRRLLLCALLVCAPVAGACGGGSPLRSGASVDDVAAPPQLLNGDEVQAAIAREYPSELRNAGISGMVRLSLFVGRDGVPTEMRLLQSSGYPGLDQAARRVASILRFRPAANRDGNPLEVWASFPILFDGS